MYMYVLIKVHVHVLVHVSHCVHCTYMYIILTELLYQLQRSNTPLHLAAMGGHTTCVEHLLSTPGIDVNVKDGVSCACTCIYK